jgi:predicted RNA-binding protein with PIN domain
MSLHYLLDGYNILKQIPAFRDLPLEDGRRGFLKWIEHSRPQGSVNNQVTVVFDGHPDYFGGSPQGEIRVIFSDGCSADDQIKRMVEEDADRKNCVVVSDDKDIFLYARSLGARS